MRALFVVLMCLAAAPRKSTRAGLQAHRQVCIGACMSIPLEFARHKLLAILIKGARLLHVLAYLRREQLQVVCDVLVGPCARLSASCAPGPARQLSQSSRHWQACDRERRRDAHGGRQQGGATFIVSRIRCPPQTESRLFMSPVSMRFTKMASVMRITFSLDVAFRVWTRTATSSILTSFSFTPPEYDNSHRQAAHWYKSCPIQPSRPSVPRSNAATHLLSLV